MVIAQCTYCRLGPRSMIYLTLTSNEVWYHIRPSVLKILAVAIIQLGKYHWDTATMLRAYKETPTPLVKGPDCPVSWTLCVLRNIISLLSFANCFDRNWKREDEGYFRARDRFGRTYNLENYSPKLTVHTHHRTLKNCGPGTTFWAENNSIYTFPI